MEDTNVLINSDEALQPLLQLAQESANSNISMIRTVVLKVLSDPKVFAGFDQIKQVLQPKLATSGTEGDPISRTLDLFSYGTYQDYTKAAAGTYLSLSDTQIFKLRQLSILSLVQQACSNSHSLVRGTKGGNTGGCVVPYKTMAQELGLIVPDGTNNNQNNNNNKSMGLDETILRQVEELALSCIYARVVTGQLCQKTAALFVTSRNGPPCRPRDVPLSQGAVMLEKLKQFHQGRLEKTQNTQDYRQRSVQMQLDANRQYLRSVLDRKKKAETNSSGAASATTALVGGRGGIQGWPDGPVQPQERRASDHNNVGGSGRRQSKRTRGSVSGGLEPSYRY